jgi:hypothetical protein
MLLQRQLAYHRTKGATGGKSGIKTTASGTAAECLTESADNTRYGGRESILGTC